MIKLPFYYHYPLTYWSQMLTLRCNGGCPYCILDCRGKHIPRKEMPAKDIIEFWNSIEKKRGKCLSLIGGEPTLYPELAEVIAGLENYSLTLTTNCQSPFYKDPDFHKKLKPHPSSILRINTTFHPHLIEPEEYIERIKQWRESDYLVDQTSFVFYPDFPYQEEVKKVKEEIDVMPAPYMGFWDDISKFESLECHGNLYPDETYPYPEASRLICGITDFGRYKEFCGQQCPSKIRCGILMLTLMVDPSGNIFPCHYRLYRNTGAIAHIKGFQVPDANAMFCLYKGFCSPCDIARLERLRRKDDGAKSYKTTE